MGVLHAKRWIISFFTIVLIILLVLAIVAYIVDPFFQFRVKDNSYMLSGWYVSSGLIERFDYDTLIIGSSMTRNFDMNVFRNEMGVKPLHTSLGGINIKETTQFINAAYDAQKAEQLFICIDLSQFNKEVTSRYPEHLLKKDFLSKLHYLLSYEVWFWYLPMDIGVMIMDQIGVKMPAKIRDYRSIDKLEDKRLNNIPKGKEVVLEKYINGIDGVSKVDTENLIERMIAHIDEFFSNLQFDVCKHIFFFPPYSSLFWFNAQKCGYFDAYLQAKEYFIQKAIQHGATVYDFQSEEFTSDLDIYSDTTHYAPEIYDWMVTCFANGHDLVTLDNYEYYLEKLTENTNCFREEYAYLLND